MLEPLFIYAGGIHCTLANWQYWDQHSKSVTAPFYRWENKEQKDSTLYLRSQLIRGGQNQTQAVWLDILFDMIWLAFKSSKESWWITLLLIKQLLQAKERNCARGTLHMSVSQYDGRLSLAFNKRKESCKSILHSISGKLKLPYVHKIDIIFISAKYFKAVHFLPWGLENLTFS